MPDTTGLEIAVIGMACRFPGADGVARFWQNLRDGVESFTHLTDADLEAAGENPDLMAHPSYVRVARLIEGADLFDAALFGFSPREAELVDPQQRLLLECAYEALEDAAYDTETYPGLVGVFAGSKMAGYIWNLYSNTEVVAAVGDLNAQIATDRDYVATRISYKLNLGGPSVTVQSACSTSLVAVHLACQALLSGECDMALAGGVSVRSEQRLGYLYREGEILSPDGHCRTFDAGAKGTIFGNGLGMVVLRRLDDALAAGDRIRAVIKGTAVNNDSSAKIGFTAPGADGQERVVRAAQTVADVHPETITMIEAHGTATSVGDPLEVTALARAFRAKTEKRGYCAIGSVKTNIGHLASAAGVAGLIKTVLALENREIPPSLFFEKPNPQIDFEDSPFYVNTVLAPWEPPAGLPRRAGVSAFGIGGTNAHAILEESPEVEPSGPSRPWQLLVLSARTETALEAMTGNLARHLAGFSTPAGNDLADAAFSLQVGRRALDVRRCLVVKNAEDAVAVLSGAAPQRLLTRAPEAERPPVAFLFSGQGSQHARMLADVYRGEAVFREELARAARLLVPHLGLGLVDLLYGERVEGTDSINQTRYAQPALFAVEYALARQWMAWGVEPQAMLGHSIGEYVAACLAGVFSLEDGLKLVAARGRLMQALPPGAMLTVPLAETELLPRLGRQLSLAATNAPARSVVSGPEEAVAALEAELLAEGVAVRRLHTSHAFHSQMMEPALAPFLEQVRQVELKAPERPYLSNVTGTWVTEAQATDPAYWVTHLRGTVRFAEGLAELLKEPHRILLEVGPGQALTALARQHPERQAGNTVLASCRKPQEDGDDQALLLGALGQLWLAGAAVSWQGFWEGERRLRAPLPAYPFERRRYWIEAKPDLVAEAPLRNKELSDWFYVPLWKPAPPPVPWSELEAPPGGPWLIFADDLGLGVRLAERLSEGGGAVATVLPGQRFQDHGGAVYEIDPARPEDYDALLTALAAGPGLPTRIVHLLTVTGPLVVEEPLLATSSRLAERGFWSLLYLLQALGRAKVAGAVELTVVSDGLAQVAEGEEVHPEKALVLGPVKVASQEYPFLSCRSVDVGFATASCPLAEQAEGLLAELGEPVGEVALAWRGGRRFVLGYQAVRLDRALEGRMPLRDQGVYLITGGLGGIGLVLAEYLARRARARLVLTSFSALPPREEWESVLATRPAGDAKVERIRKVLALEELGAEVMVAQADAADEAATLRVIGAARERFGAIHGVIHSAGVAGGGIVQTKAREVAARVLDPKVKGTRLLEAALGQLDFFVVCSSTIALFGNFGQVDYCAANNFLDAFARYHTDRTGVPTLSINWGAWKEVGMAVNAPAPAGAAELVRGLTSRPAPHHPMLESSAVDTAGRAIYGKTWRPGEHWLIDDHRVLGTPTLPGTGYLEMARAAFEAETGLAAAEIRDVFFLGPMMVAEPRESRVTLEKGGPGYSFKVQSRPVGAQGGDWQDHALGKVLPANGADGERRDLSELRSRMAGEPLAIAEEMMGDREKLVYWGDHWKVVRQIHVGEEEALAELAVAEGTSGNEGFGLHPAMLDVATALSGLLAQKSYLPFSYRRLTTAGPLPPRFLAHVRRRPAADEESIVADVTLLGEDGQVLADVTEFALKKVGQAVGRLQKGTAVSPSASGDPTSSPAQAPAATAKPAAGLFSQGGMLSSEGLESFRRILSRRLGPQVAVSPRDVNAILEQAAKARSRGSLEEMAKAVPKRAAHPRPSLQTAFAPPASPTEEALAAVWQDVLGIDTVGIHDNFFELGGDSILGIQVLTRAREAGIEMTSNQLFAHQTIAELAQALMKEGGSLPSAPMPGGGREVAELELEPALQSQLAGLDVEEVYPLSPLQEGLLFHAAQAPESGLYIEQIRIPFFGTLDEPAMARAWQLAVDRHPALRTAFFWEHLERPMQAVLRRVELPVERHDWSHLSETERRARGNAWLAEDAVRGFPLSQAPLMRLALVRTGEESCEILWSHHHLILDGWSSPLLMEEIFGNYRRLSAGEPPRTGPAPRFRPYVDWLARQDIGRSEAFFRALLAGYRRPTPIGADRPVDGRPAAPSDYGHATAAVPEEATTAVQALARREQLTLNSAVQGIWALLSAHAAGTDEVVYGVSLSSRPAGVPDVESIVGLFINVLPMRVRISQEKPFTAWLKELHAAQIALLDHAHTPLVAVHGASEVPRELPLFESVFEFWNFPFRLPAGERGDLATNTANFFYGVATNFPLSLRAVPFSGLQLQLTYDRRRFDEATADARVKALAVALEAFAARPEATGAELLELVEERQREARQERAAALSGVAQERLRQIPRRRAAVEPGT